MINVMMVDQDDSAVSKGIAAGARADRNLKVTAADAGTARDAVRRGKTAVAVIVPKGFGDQAGAAFFGTGS
jgi:hypothetical protein